MTDASRHDRHDRHDRPATTLPATLQQPLPALPRRAGRAAATAVATALSAALAASLLTGCAPLVVGGAMVGGTMLAADRRTSGAQIEDQAIELKAAQRIREAVGERGHVNATSYNRIVLLTGEAASDADRAAIEQVVARVENVRSVVNELAVMGASSLTSRSSDAIVSGKVKAAFVDARDLQAHNIKVTTERGTVYLMGIATEREATRAAEVARQIGGVQRVVRVFEVVSEADLARIVPAPQTGSATPAR